MKSKIKLRQRWSKVLGFLVLVLLQYPTVTAVTGVLDIQRITRSRSPYGRQHVTLSLLGLRQPGDGHPFGTLLQQPSRRTRTQLGHVADSFASVELLTHPENASKDIPVDQLLDALHKFHSVLKKTAPTAVTRDFHNNLIKAESSYHDYLRRHQRHTSGRQVTLSSLLRHERDSGIHQAGDQAVLSDPSGAMGLLWIRRNLAFQADMYEHIVRGADPKQAAMIAYEQQLHPYHGWALRKLFQAGGVSRMPSRDELLAKIGGYGDEIVSLPHAEQATLEDLKHIVTLWRPLIKHWKDHFVELGMEDVRRV